MRIDRTIINLGLTIFWRLRPATSGALMPGESTTSSQQAPDEIDALRSLLRRFPFWIAGRHHLAEASLAANDIATAYCEAQALQTLSPHRRRDKGRALFVLGRCYLRRGDSGSAVTLLNDAKDLLPHSYSLQEEIAAALTLHGDKAKALQILKEIPQEKITAEGKAALRWLSSTSEPSVR